jgi:hypothetical protein
MRKFSWVIILISVSFLTYAQQDTITKINGDKILCRIQKEDSTNVYISIRWNNQDINTYLPKNQIKSTGYYKAPILDNMSIGLGLGMDYGGIGSSVLIYPQKNIGFFAGLGYAMEIGFNIGCKLRLIGDKHTSHLYPYLLGMYGYNAIIVVSNNKQYNKTFYGPTLGFGCDLRSSPKKRSYWTFAVLIPIRGSEVENYMDDLKNNNGVIFKNNLFPITISIGHRFILK